MTRFTSISALDADKRQPVFTFSIAEAYAARTKSSFTSSGPALVSEIANPEVLLPFLPSNIITLQLHVARS